MSRLASLAATLVAAAVAAGCCANGTCIKDPPCRCDENPCCLAPIQKAALSASTHALPAPVAYRWDEKVFVLFTEKGRKDFEANPMKFDEAGSVRIIRKGKTYRCDINPSKEGEPDWPSVAAQAVPFTPPPAPAK